MSDYDYDYEEADEQESETTLQSAREQLEFWTEFYEEEKENKPDEWIFYRNPFLDPSVYAYWILTEEEKELVVHWNRQSDTEIQNFGVGFI